MWTTEQVAAVAPTPAALAAAEPLADPQRWSGLGADHQVVWGRSRGSGAEPYDTAVDHVEAVWRCSCPSRRRPCKHALALLLLWARAGVPEGVRPAPVAAWIAGRDRRPVAPGGATGGSSQAGSDPVPVPPRDRAADDVSPVGRDQLDHSRDERVARMVAALAELDRWLEDRLRTGLADPALARYATWDALAARLVDGRAGALANRVRRLAGLVGAGPDWHGEVLAELGLLHLIAQAGRRLPGLPGPLADAAAVAAGWQVRHADVLDGAPDTDEWFVAGRSDTREDRIEVRRVWLWGTRSGRWALLLSFAAYGQGLDDSFTVGTVVPAELHRYPGGALRALAGRRLADPLPLAPPTAPPAGTVVEACDAIGAVVAAEPWLERYPARVRGAASVRSGRWVLTDATGSVPLQGDDRALGALLGACAGSPDAMADVTVEWTPWGVRLLTVHLADRALDVGPLADASFVGAG